MASWVASDLAQRLSGKTRITIENRQNNAVLRQIQRTWAVGHALFQGVAGIIGHGEDKLAPFGFIDLVDGSDVGVNRRDLRY